MYAYLLLLGRKVRTVLVAEIAQCARYGQVTVNTIPLDKASSGVYSLALKGQGWLVVERQGFRATGNAHHATRIARIGTDNVLGRHNSGDRCAATGVVAVRSLLVNSHLLIQGQKGRDHGLPYEFVVFHTLTYVLFPLIRSL